MTQKLVLASGNKGKLREFGEVLLPLGFEVVAQSEFNVPEVDETGLTFVENALLKAREASRVSGLPALADDSGIEVDALNGAPGIYSARFSGAGATDQRNNEKLLAELAGLDKSQRTARYWCVLVYLRHADDPTPIIAQGSWEGSILEQPQGEGGFGYDPLFWIEELNCTAAQLTPEQKNQRSHRGKATLDLVAQLKKRTL
ncbi:XTP/dITP diphosphohydrolase [Oceanospirillum multiglobuliferum]|uniref:dITP/XTP pyrophosphatase n=1 Tax=Oceanospirillum multiglobuliferum TaxID=64969 RepID=A0A1T4SFB0_9GAMM|nr:RdgB/HAM1 family non-canonical purine NTP pyrophosphatase [Oceanospirillum multiglobuliferum]OPX54307.1 non-canonical purine NTP pyrophosphatase, RdgB/HAM1 family [Oceanospirillum multiglobuliferum]SKA26859.1 XTP/dITP diphosphohydrolase [Oceanospirillum multiglobuliferum]